MKSFFDLTAAAALKKLDEGTIHLRAHGTEGTHYEVMKGHKALKKGEVINDTAVDDLHDMGHNVEIHEETLGEASGALRLVKTHVNGTKSAKVYKDTDWGEYRVKHYEGNNHLTKADYHTDDLEDAHGTAKHFIKEDYQNHEGLAARRKASADLAVKKQKDVEDSYADHHKQAMDHVESLMKQVRAAHPDKMKGKVTWGHVGSMEQMHKDIKNVHGYDFGPKE